jgi:hypothetical protein
MRVKANNSYVKTLIFGSFFFITFLSNFSHPFSFFDPVFYCICSFPICFVTPFIFLVLFHSCPYFLANVISSLILPQLCLEIKVFIVIVVVRAYLPTAIRSASNYFSVLTYLLPYSYKSEATQ